MTAGLDRRNWATVIPPAAASDAHVSPWTALILRVQSAATWVPKPRARTRIVLKRVDGAMVSVVDGCESGL